MDSESVQLAHFELQEREVQHALGRVKARDVDYADIYFESRVSESVSMEEGIVKRAVKSISRGAGVRATAGEKTGFAYSDALSRRDLEIAADTARYIANSPQGDTPVPVT
ncbi:MAG: metalloprotease TldD, partial [Nitrospirae bacterium]|nr:metalloprotease TldD [Nitrospirota bacterium]